MLNVNSVKKSIVGYLRGQIISGELRPGQRLNEIALSKQLEVSRPPLREAFQVLEQEGLVVSISRKGTFVTTVSLDDLNELYEAREILEISAIHLLRKKKRLDLQKLFSFLSESRNVPAFPGEIFEKLLFYREKISDFHVILLETTGNQRLIHFYQTIYFNLARYQYMQFSLFPESMTNSLEKHRQILDLLDGQLFEEAEQLLQAHIQDAYNHQKIALLKYQETMDNN